MAPASPGPVGAAVPAVGASPAGTTGGAQLPDVTSNAPAASGAAPTPQQSAARPKDENFFTDTPEPDSAAPPGAPSAASLDDPSEELTNQNRAVYESLLEEFAPYAARLRDSSILVIVSPHEDLTSSAAIFVSSHSSLGNARPRVLIECTGPLTDILASRNRWRIGHTEQTQGGREVVLLIHAHSTQHLAHVRDLLKSRRGQGFPVDQKFFVIIELSDEAGRGFNPLMDSAGFPVWEIDAVPHLLRQHHTPQDADDWLARVQAARARGAGPADARDFAYWLDAHLRHGTLSGALDATTRPEHIPTGREILSQANRVEKCALFAAAMFPGAKMGEFETLVQALVKEETCQPPAASRSGGDAPAPIPGPVYWERHQEELYQKLQLEHRQESGSMVVDFRLPSLRDGVRSALFPPDVTRWLNRLHQDGMLLDPALSRALINRLVEITAEAARDRDDIFNRHWLLARLRDIQHQRARFSGLQSQLDQASQAPELRSLLSTLRKTHRAQHRQLMAALTAICRSFLGSPTTQPAATGFLDDLIQETQPECEDALDIIFRLDGTSGFEPGRYYFRLLNSTNTRLRTRIHRHLLSRAKERQGHHGPQQAWDTISEVYRWLPAPDPQLSFGAGHRWTLAFLYSLWEDYRDACSKVGCAEQDIPIPWLAECPDLPTPETRLQTILQWLSHTQLPNCVEEVIRSITKELRSGTGGSLQWTMMEYYYHPRTVGEGLVAEVLAGFYLLSGDERWHQIADHLRQTLPLKTREALNAIIRQIGDAPLDATPSATVPTRAALEKHRIRVRRAYSLARRLLVATTS